MIHDYLNLLLLPINYHFSSSLVLVVSLDSVEWGVETFGAYVLFILILLFVTYYRNTFLSIFVSRNDSNTKTEGNNRAKLQSLTKSVTQSFKPTISSIKSTFTKFLK